MKVVNFAEPDGDNSLFDRVPPNYPSLSIKVVALDTFAAELKLIVQAEFFSRKQKSDCYITFNGKFLNIRSRGSAEGYNRNLMSESLAQAVCNAGFSFDTRIDSLSLSGMESVLEEIARWDGYTVVKAF